jgi:hypothetical protein
MSSPVYDGKGQPPPASGWFTGLAEWWNSLTPQDVTESRPNAARVAKATEAPQAVTTTPDADLDLDAIKP